MKRIVFLIVVYSLFSGVVAQGQLQFGAGLMWESLGRDELSQRYHVGGQVSYLTNHRVLFTLEGYTMRLGVYGYGVKLYNPNGSESGDYVYRSYVMKYRTQYYFDRFDPRSGFMGSSIGCRLIRGSFRPESGGIQDDVNFVYFPLHWYIGWSAKYNHVMTEYYFGIGVNMGDARWNEYLGQMGLEIPIRSVFGISLRFF